jgi:hypothetical protein
MQLAVFKPAVILGLTLIAFQAAPAAGVAEDSVGQARRAIQVSVNKPDGKYLEGDLLRLTIHAEVDAYIYCIYHQANGSSLLLFPNIVERNYRIRARTRVQIPTDEQVLYFQVSAPFGAEMLQVLAASRPLSDFDELLGPGATGVPIISRDTINQWCKRFAAQNALIQEDRIYFQTAPRDRNDG